MPNWVRNVVEIKTNIEDGVRNKEVLEKIEDFYIKKDGGETYVDLTKTLDTSLVLEMGIGSNTLHNAKCIAAKIMDKYNMTIQDVTTLLNNHSRLEHELTLAIGEKSLKSMVIHTIGYNNYSYMLFDFMDRNAEDVCIKDTNVKVKDLIFKDECGNNIRKYVCFSIDRMFDKIILERSWDRFIVVGMTVYPKENFSLRDVMDEIVAFFINEKNVELTPDHFIIKIQDIYELPTFGLNHFTTESISKICDWYNFNLKHIGTKSSLMRFDHLTDEEDRYIAISFETAWAEPSGWFNHMCRKLIPTILNGEEVVTVNMISQEEQIMSIELYSTNIRSSGAEFFTYTESNLQYRYSLKNFLESNGLEEYIGDFYNRWDLAVEWAIDEGHLPDNYEAMSASEIDDYVDEKMEGGDK